MVNPKDEKSYLTRQEGSFAHTVREGRPVVLVKLQCLRCSCQVFVKTVLPADMGRTNEEIQKNLEKKLGKENTYYNCGTCGKSDMLKVYEDPKSKTRKFDRENI